MLLANPFHSGIVFIKKEFLYCSLPLFGGIWKGLLLFVTYCSTMFFDTQSLNCLGLMFLLFLIGSKYLSGGSDGMVPSAILKRNESLRWRLLVCNEGRSSSRSMFDTHPGVLVR